MTIAVLSWGSHPTLINSLTSYEMFGLTDLDKDKVVFFQEITETDREIATRFGYEAIGSEENIGIAEAYKQLVEYAKGDFFLFLENDWVLLDDPKEEMYEAANMLAKGKIDVARFRHRRFPGDPLWTKQFQGQELEHLTHLLDAIHWTYYMDKEFPSYVWSPSEHWYATKAMYANWTNNPTMFRTAWLKSYIVPRLGTRDIEIDLQPWWEQQEFIVAQGNGLFTHNRIG